MGVSSELLWLNKCVCVFFSELLSRVRDLRLEFQQPFWVCFFPFPSASITSDIHRDSFFFFFFFYFLQKTLEKKEENSLFFLFQTSTCQLFLFASSLHQQANYVAIKLYQKHLWVSNFRSTAFILARAFYRAGCFLIWFVVIDDVIFFFFARQSLSACQCYCVFSTL